MEPIRDLAIILKSTRYQERDLILSAITQNHGILSAVARNSVNSRRFGSSLEVFTASEWTLKLHPDRELSFLLEANLKEAFTEISRDFQLLSLASALNEYLLRLAPQHESCQDLFRLHSNALHALKSHFDPKKIVLFLNAYLVKLLQWGGHQPSLQECHRCQRELMALDPKTLVECSVLNGSWRCKTCSTKPNSQHQPGSDLNPDFTLSARVIQDLQRSLGTPIRQVSQQLQASEDEHRTLFAFLDSFVAYHLPGFEQNPIKSLRFLGLKSISQHPTKTLR